MAQPLAPPSYSSQAPEPRRHAELVAWLGSDYKPSHAVTASQLASYDQIKEMILENGVTASFACDDEFRGGVCGGDGVEPNRRDKDSSDKGGARG